MKTATALLFSAVALAGCGTGPMATESEGMATGQVIGTLVGRDQQVTFHATGQGPRFTVSTRDGRVLAEGLTLDELQAFHPDLYRLYRTSVAGPVFAM